MHNFVDVAENLADALPRRHVAGGLRACGRWGYLGCHVFLPRAVSNPVRPRSRVEPSDTPERRRVRPPGSGKPHRSGVSSFLLPIRWARCATAGTIPETGRKPASRPSPKAAPETGDRSEEHTSELKPLRRTSNS